MPTEDNKSIVRRYLEEVWGRGQFGNIRQYLDRDVVDHAPAPGQPCGQEGQEWVARGFLGALSNYRLTVDQLVGQGDRVFDHWTFSATHTGDLFGMPATGRKFTIAGTDESRLVDGKIVELWHREDFLSMTQQLGFAPAPPLPQSFGRPNSSTTATATARTTSTGLPSEQEMRARVRDSFRAMIDRGDFSSIDGFLTPDYVGHFSAFPPVYGPEGFRQYLSIYVNGLSERRTDIQDILIEGDRVAVRARYYGKNTGTMLGMPPSGKSVDVESLMIIRMVGDRAAEQWANDDDLGMMQQLGVIPEQAVAELVPC